jgi:hypothetical protein
MCHLIAQFVLPQQSTPQRKSSFNSKQNAHLLQTQIVFFFIQVFLIVAFTFVVSVKEVHQRREAPCRPHTLFQTKDYKFEPILFSIFQHYVAKWMSENKHSQHNVNMVNILKWLRRSWAGVWHGACLG